jgi:hypothetical protein
MFRTTGTLVVCWLTGLKHAWAAEPTAECCRADAVSLISAGTDLAPVLADLPDGHSHRLHP